MEREQRIIKLGGQCGILGVLLYIASQAANALLPQSNTTQEFLALMGDHYYGRLSLGLHFLFAAAVMLWIVAFLGLKRLLSSERPNFALTVGTLFGIIACAIMAQMMIIQGSVMVRMGRAFAAATDEAQRQNTIALYKGLRYIDYGMDLAFDTFFFSAWILLAFGMLRHHRFGRMFGGIGLAFFVIAAIFNLQAAPDPPLFDIGPIAAFWVLAVYIQMVRSAKTASRVEAKESLA